MFGRTRYQQGSLQRVERKTGPDCWVFRWRDADGQGIRHRRKLVVGTVADYPTASSAEAAVAALRMNINVEVSRAAGQPISVRDLIAHYKEMELKLEAAGDDAGESEKAFSTKQTYRVFLDRWIEPRWGHLRIQDVRTVAVEAWLKQLTLADGRRMAPGTKAKARNIMHALFNHAIRYEWLAQNVNPITRVRQSAKRERIPDILEVGEFQSLLQELALRERLLVALDATTGLRRSELIGLKWSDVDFDSLTISVTRSVVSGVVGVCKTEASRKPVPLVSAVAEDLWLWKQAALYKRPEDWVFASLKMKGTKPMRPGMILKRYIQPAAQRAGIHKRIGWHTFRHTYSTLLKANGEDVKVVQELLRHANIKITMDTYTQALSPAKRDAQRRVATMILPERKALPSPNWTLLDPRASAGQPVSDRKIW